MKLYISLSSMLLLLLVVVSGCASPAAPPASDPIAVHALNAEYSWIGWGSKGYTMDVSCTGDNCTATATCKNATGQEEINTTPDPVILDATALADLGVSLGSLRRVDTPQEVIERTDDYPNYTITLTADNGQEIMVTSTSNTENNAPWNIKIEDRLYVQEGTAFPDAYFALLGKVDPASCW